MQEACKAAHDLILDYATATDFFASYILFHKECIAIIEKAKDNVRHYGN